jgi:AcrR family transcriptional regulator
VSTPGVTRVDGRTARRDRNRDAVLDAVHEAFGERGTLPTMEDVAERSGVSLRSIYRYFSDAQQLLLAALARRIALMEPLWQQPDLGCGTLDERVAALLSHRLWLYDENRPTIRAAFELAESTPDIAEQIQRRRRQLLGQTCEQFAAELVRCSPEEANRRATCVEVLCQFESLELLRRTQGLTRDEAFEVLATGVRAVVAASPR